MFDPSHPPKKTVALVAALLSISSYASDLYFVPAGNYSTAVPDGQVIDIERVLGDMDPDQILVCIDRKKVAWLRKGQGVRIFLNAARTHDLYLVTRGVKNCDVNQVVTVTEIPTETPIWKVGVERLDTIKILQGVKR